MMPHRPVLLRRARNRALAAGRRRGRSIGAAPIAARSAARDRSARPSARPPAGRTLSYFLGRSGCRPSDRRRRSAFGSPRSAAGAPPPARSAGLSRSRRKRDGAWAVGQLPVQLVPASLRTASRMMRQRLTSGRSAARARRSSPWGGDRAGRGTAPRGPITSLRHAAAVEGLQLLELLARENPGPSSRCPRSAASSRSASRWPSARPRARSTIHLSTRMFSPKPGQRNLPSASLRNQFTWKMRGVSDEPPLHLDPVPEVIAHVVAAEGQHRHRVAAHLADRAGRGGRHLRAHRRADVDAGAPVEGLVDQRHRRRAAAAEDDGADRHALGLLPVGIDGRALRGRRGEAGVGMRGLRAGLLADLRRPGACPASRGSRPAARRSCLPTRRRLRGSARRW